MRIRAPLHLLRKFRRRHQRDDHRALFLLARRSCVSVGRCVDLGDRRVQRHGRSDSLARPAVSTSRGLYILLASRVVDGPENTVAAMHLFCTWTVTIDAKCSRPTAT